MDVLKGIKVIIFDWGDTLMKDFEEYVDPMYKWPKVEVMPYIKETLESLHENYICCVASNAGQSNAETMGLALERVDIRMYFKYLFTSKELDYPKEDKRFYLEIANRLNVAPEYCLMVGNDYYKDIVPSKAAGMKTSLLSMDLSSKFSEADYIISSTKELIRLLDLK